jgi:hypothetical protein
METGTLKNNEKKSVWKKIGDKMTKIRRKIKNWFVKSKRDKEGKINKKDKDAGNSMKDEKVEMDA